MVSDDDLQRKRIEAANKAARKAQKAARKAERRRIRIENREQKVPKSRRLRTKRDE